MRGVREFVSDDATEARRVILLDADKRKKVARRVVTVAFDADDDAAETPIKIGPKEHLRSRIITASLEERHSLATKWATLRWSHAKSNNLGISSAEVCAEAAELFGDDAVPKDSTVRNIALAGKAGKSPKKSRQPKVVPDGINAKLAEFVELIRSHKIPMYKHSVIICIYLTALVEGSPIGAKLTTDGKWDFKKLDHWYYGYFLKLDGISTGAQRLLDIARDRWQTFKNARAFFDYAKKELVAAGIAIVNPDWTPFEILSHHLGMTVSQFKECVKSHPEEITFVSGKAHLALSLDELKVLLSTHDDCHRRCEQTLKSGPGDNGETLSAKSNCAMPGIGGSHANFEGARPGFFLASENMNPAWIRSAPRVVINGVRFDIPFNEGNKKGSSRRRCSSSISHISGRFARKTNGSFVSLMAFSRT